MHFRRLLSMGFIPVCLATPIGVQKRQGIVQQTVYGYETQTPDLSACICDIELGSFTNPDVYYATCPVNTTVRYSLDSFLSYPNSQPN